MIQFAIACTVSRAVDRRVIIPNMAWMALSQIPKERDEEAQTPPEEIIWMAFDEYFDRKVPLPCKEMTLANMNSLYITLDVESGKTITHPEVKANLIDRAQILLHINVKAFKAQPIPKDLTQDSLKNAFKSIQQFLILGAAIPESLGITFPADLKKLAAVEGFLETIQIIITPRDALLRLREQALEVMDDNYLGIHLWRGPKAQAKCEATRAGSDCLPSLEQTQESLKEIFERTKTKTAFITTSLEPSDSELESIITWMKEKGGLEKVYRLTDLVDIHNPLVLDKLQTEQLERWMLIKSKLFVGNFYSSFSQLVDFARQSYRDDRLQTVWINGVDSS